MDVFGPWKKAARENSHGHRMNMPTPQKKTQQTSRSEPLCQIMRKRETRVVATYQQESLSKQEPSKTTFPPELRTPSTKRVPGSSLDFLKNIKTISANFCYINMISICEDIMGNGPTSQWWRLLPKSPPLDWLQKWITPKLGQGPKRQCKSVQNFFFFWVNWTKYKH